jgi:hypothetical protein
VTADRHSPAVREQAAVAALDVIEARRVRGEITDAEAEALHDAEVERALLENIVVHAAAADRREDAGVPILGMVFAVLIVLTLGAVLFFQFRA